MKVLVTYAARTGSTGDVADAVARRLEDRGLAVDVRPCAHARDAWRYDAVVLGSAKHGHQWERSAVDYLRAQAPDLAERPTWLFQTGCCADEADHHKDLPRSVRHLLEEIGLDDPVDLGGRAEERPEGLGAADLRAVHDWADQVADTLRSPSVVGPTVTSPERALVGAGVR